MTGERGDTTAATDRLGTLRETGDGWELRYIRSLAEPPATVWRAFVDPDLVGRWFPSSIVGDLVVGGPLRFEVKSHDAEPFDGTVLEVDEPHRLSIRWGPDILHFELAELTAVRS